MGGEFLNFKLSSLQRLAHTHTLTLAPTCTHSYTHSHRRTHSHATHRWASTVSLKTRSKFKVFLPPFDSFEGKSQKFEIWKKLSSWKLVGYSLLKGFYKTIIVKGIHESIMLIKVAWGHEFEPNYCKLLFYKTCHFVLCLFSHWERTQQEKWVYLKLTCG